MRKIYQKKKNSQLFYVFSKRLDVRHDTNNNPSGNARPTLTRLTNKKVMEPFCDRINLYIGL